MDATANEIQHAGVNVKGFPTIYFFPGNDKANPIRYEDKRELEYFQDFLRRKGAHKIDVRTESGKAAVNKTAAEGEDEEEFGAGSEEL